MKEKKIIFLKRCLLLFGVSVLILIFSGIVSAMEDPVIPDTKESISDDEAGKDSPPLPETGPISDPLPSSEFLLPEEDLPLEETVPQIPLSETPVPDEETDAEDSSLANPGSFKEGQRQPEETETPDSEENESESRKSLAGAGPFALPISRMTGFLVTWTNSEDELIFSNDRGERWGSLSDISGTYTLKVAITCAEDCNALEPGASYTLQLDWPEGDAVSVNLSEYSGDIVYTDTKSSQEVYIGFWTLDEDGLFTLFIADTAANTNRWEGYFAVQAFVSNDYDEPSASASILKESRYDPASGSITWTITTGIPAYAGSGKCSSWYIDDEITVEIGSLLKNDMADVRVSISSGGSNGEVPALSEASEGCPIAYALEDLGTSKERLYFLTPCSCKQENCQNYKDCCANTVGPGPDGRPWCSCWDYRYNASFTVTYSVGVAEVLQDLANYTNLNTFTYVTNRAVLNLNGRTNQSALVMETLKNVMGKEEILPPNKSNDYTASYQIIVNPAGEDYKSADYLSIEDSMTNLSLVTGTLAVTTSAGASLEPGSNAMITALSREGNEDRYFSFEASQVEENKEGMPAQTLLIRIWYPTDQTYTITYDAMVVDPELGRDGSYGNQAALGGVSVSTEGRGYWEAGEWDGMSNAVTFEKVDADAKDQKLSGAKFEVWQYDKDGSYLITTLTTGEDGTAVFQTDRRAGYFVKTNTLYYLKETEAPPGYLCGEDPYWFYLREAGTAGIPEEEMPAELLDDSGALREDANLHIEEMPQSGEGALVLEIENERETPEGALLPQTGGRGEIPGTATALFLFIAAAVLLFSRRKKHLNNGEIFNE